VNVASFDQVWVYAASALQVLVSFHTLAVIGLGAVAYWLIPHRHRAWALIAISVAVVLLGYQRPALLVVATAVVCGLVYAAVRARLPRRWVVVAVVALYGGLHGLFGLLTFTPWLSWSGLTPEYVLPTIGLTAAFTFLRMIHFSVDYGAAQPTFANETAPAAAPSAPHPVTYAAWCLFFPTFVHLPLIRYQAWADQFANLPLRLEMRHLRLAMARIGQALVKGVFIALVYLALNPNGILLNPASRPFAELFAAAIVSAVLYYIGFSAFVDLGIGAASLYGIALPENFAPVRKMVSINRMRDFWRNWNITTTRWLNEYVYQPLGGHRRHPVRNVLLTMTACGLWHSVSLFGAAWGLSLGLLLVIEHGWNRLRIRHGWPEVPPPLRSALLLCAISFINLALTPYGYTAQSARYLYPLYWLGLAT
jgi:D-alanyl-lipoteichoic acid acyltransferase DltB (MBOAT superfamily)